MAKASAQRGSDRDLALLVNGESRAVPQGCTVAGLLRRLGLERRRIAVAVNRDVVPRSRFATHPLAAGDRVEILEAVGGG
jgi:sulfur carrier protein